MSWIHTADAWAAYQSPGVLSLVIYAWAVLVAAFAFYWLSRH